MTSITTLDITTDNTTASTPDLIPAPLTGTDLSTHVRSMLSTIELDVTTSYTLADAMREGSSFTTQRIGGYVSGNQHCALAAAVLAARARDY